MKPEVTKYEPFVVKEAAGWTVKWPDGGMLAHRWWALKSEAEAYRNGWNAGQEDGW